jgi:hypothetical protein
MSHAEPVTRGKEAGGKKAAGKGDPRIQPDTLSSRTDEQTADTPTTAANPPLPVQLAPSPLPLAPLKFVTLQAVTPEATTKDKPAPEPVTRGHVPTTTAANPPLPVQLAPSPLPLAPLKFVTLQVVTPEATTAEKDKPASEPVTRGHGPTTMTANPPLPVQLVPSPLQVADLKFVPPQVAASQFTTEDKPVSAPVTHEDAPTKATTTAATTTVTANPPLPAQLAPNPLPMADLKFVFAKPIHAEPATVTEGAKESKQIGGATQDPQLIASPTALPLPTNFLGQPSVAPGEEVSFTADTPQVVAVQVTVSQSQTPVPQRALAEAHKANSTASEQARPQPIDTTARIVPRLAASEILPLLKPIPEAKFSPATEGARVSRPGAKTENAPAEKSSSAPATSTSRPPPTEVVPAEIVLLEPGAPSPPLRINVSEAGQDKTKKGAPAPIANETRSTASSVAQAPEQLLAETPAAGKTTRPVTAEAVPESKDSPDKKASVSSPQSTLAPHEIFAPVALARETGTTVVVPAEAGSAPRTHAPPSETREVPKTPPMVDATPAGAPPAARVTTEPGGEMQMRVGIRTTAFGAVEIYTSVHMNQVGLAVHGERGLAHWFSAEVQNIESGLKDHRLNLTTVELDKGGTGLQTATGSQHHHSQRNFFAPRGSRNNLTPERADEIEPFEAALPGLPAWSGETRVSILI